MSKTRSVMGKLLLLLTVVGFGAGVYSVSQMSQTGTEPFAPLQVAIGYMSLIVYLAWIKDSIREAVLTTGSFLAFAVAFRFDLEPQWEAVAYIVCAFFALFLIVEWQQQLTRWQHRMEFGTAEPTTDNDIGGNHDRV